MAIIICPYKVMRDNFDRLCSKELCAIWYEPLEMCSHKATALMLYDVHQVTIRFGIAQGFVNLPEEDKNDNP